MNAPIASTKPANHQRTRQVKRGPNAIRKTRAGLATILALLASSRINSSESIPPSLREATKPDPLTVRVRRARQLTLVPYLTSGILSCAAGALNPVGPVLILISAGASSFGEHSGLAWMASLLYSPRISSTQLHMSEIKRAWGWVIAAVVLAIVFAGPGPGVKFHSGRVG